MSILGIWYEVTNISDSLTWDNIVDQSPKDAKWAYLTDVFPVNYKLNL